MLWIQYLQYTVYCRYTWHTIAAKIDHDVSLSVHKALECKWGDITPHFEGSEESIVYDFLIQVGAVSEDSTE